ncbi:MAG: hypothetical protein ACRDK4_03600 [Solirubrobacteraceae bacterium]
MELDHHSLADLVRLRSMLERAKLLAGDLSSEGRHFAVIALDGVVEYAMGIAAAHRQLKLSPSAGFHKAMNALVECFGSNWQRPVRRGVIQLHEARNSAQHGGAAPDQTMVPGWTDEVEAFVNSLVLEAFGVALEQVLLADAIEREDLRGLVAEAERAIADRQPELGFDIAYSALIAARRLWHEQQQDAYGRMPPPGMFASDPRHVDPRSRSADYADVGVFAEDLGEYHWLIATRRLRAEDMPPNLEDARRALQFAYHWILRWQGFDARYPHERWRAHFDSLAPPVFGDGRTPGIRWVEVEPAQMIGPRELDRVIVSLANLPERGRDDWGIDINTALRRTAELMGWPNTRVIAGPRSATGQFTFLAEHDLTSEEISEALQLTVHETTSLYRARRDETERTAREAAERTVELEALLTPHRSFFGDIHSSRQIRSDGEVIFLAIDYTGSAHELGEMAGILRNRGGHLNDTHVGEGQLVLNARAVEGPSRELLIEALAAAVDHVLHVRRFAAEREEERARREDELQALLGSPLEGSETSLPAG